MSNSVLFFVVVVGIPVVAGVLNDMYKRHMKFKEQQLEADRTAGPANAEWVARMERLEDRVRVLERIITDKGHHLAEEIEKLRDKPLN